MMFKVVIALTFFSADMDFSGELGPFSSCFWISQFLHLLSGKRGSESESG